MRFVVWLLVVAVFAASLALSPFSYNYTHSRARDENNQQTTHKTKGFCPETSLFRAMPSFIVPLFRVAVPIMMRLKGSPQRPSTAAKSGAYLGGLACDEAFAGQSGKVCCAWWLFGGGRAPPRSTLPKPRTRPCRSIMHTTLTNTNH